MTLPTFVVAVNRLFVNKLERGYPQWGRFNDSFENLTLTTEELREEIRAGHAFTSPHAHERHKRRERENTLQYRLKDPKPTNRQRKLYGNKLSSYRCEENWLSSQHFALDHDSLGFDDVLNLKDGFIRRYGAFLYTTVSHTPDAPRSRSVFILEQPITDKKRYREATEALLWKFSGAVDLSCKDVAQCYFGSKDCEILDLGNLLPLAVIDAICCEFRTAMEEERAAREAERNRRPRSNYPPSTPSLAEIAEALSYIPPWTHYHTWLRLLMAVHSVYPGEDGIAVCEAWSPGYPDEIEYRFDTFSQEGNDAGSITIATLFHIAKEYGWKPQRHTQSEVNFSGEASQYDVHVSIVGEANKMPPLPQNAYIDPEVAAGASPWLDGYIEHSRKWSPRSYDGFHEAVGLWLLSTVAARRVQLDFGGPRFTNLYLCLATRTSRASKTTAAKVGIGMLHEAGLNHLLAPDDATPQAFINALAGKVPDDWGQWSTRRQNQFLAHLAFAGQKGWFYEEFGQKVSAMMKEGGYMADFRGMLKRFDDTPETYEYRTISRGNDLITAPYLALLANVTPADLRSFAKRGAALWGDGFWARVALITAPPDAPTLTGRFPEGKRVLPPELLQKLKEWHQRLGIPKATVTKQTMVAGRGNYRGGIKYDVVVDKPDPKECVFGNGVIDAFYRYHDALTIDLYDQKPSTDLDGNYNRFAEKALRVAMLLGSLENDDRIEMRHWARAQQIAESWRQNLHCFYAEVTGSHRSPGEEIEEKIMKLIEKKGPLTKREICQGVRGIDTRMTEIYLSSMMSAGLLEIMQGSDPKRFSIAA